MEAYGVSSARKKGPIQIGPTQAGTAPIVSFIALLLVEPVLGTCKVFRPIIQVEIAPPGLGFSLLPIIRRIPWDISPGFPWQPILLAHRSLRCDAAPHHAAPIPELPCRGTGFQPLR